jgi:hypothetical protein
VGNTNKLARKAVGKIVIAEMNRTDENAETKPSILDYIADVIVALNDQLPDSAKVFEYDD